METSNIIKVIIQPGGKTAKEINSDIELSIENIISKSVGIYIVETEVDRVLLFVGTTYNAKKIDNNKCIIL